MITNNGGLLTMEQGGKSVCLPYLLNFPGKGVFAPNGKIDAITEADADTHNRLLSEGELKGLDENCQVGQYGTFYYINGKVTTFMGTVVSTTIRLKGNSITFWRNSKEYRGRLQKEADCFNFRRIK